MLNKDLGPIIKVILLMLSDIFQHKHSILPLRIFIVSFLQAKNQKQLKLFHRNWF
jgi:hypothetical protein